MRIDLRRIIYLVIIFFIHFSLLNLIFFYLFKNGFFNIWLNILLTFYSSVLWKKYKFIEQKQAIDINVIFIIILLTIFFKFNLYPWIGGGQDQGVYMNMGKSFQNKIFLEHDDKILKNVEKKEELKLLNLERQFEPGTYVWTYGEAYRNKYGKPPDDKTDYNISLNGKKNFQFLPLNSLNFHISNYFIGSDKPYILILYSIFIIIIFFSIINEKINTKYSLIFIFLFSVNPLLNFFAKFPSASLLQLLINCIMFFLINDLFKKENKYYKYTIYLILIAFTVGCFNRIDAFLYLPFFFITNLVIIFSKNINDRSLSFLFYGYLPTIIITVLTYYIHFNYNSFYAQNIFNQHFFEIFGKNYFNYLAIILTSSVIFLYLIYHIKNKLFEIINLLFSNINFYFLIIFLFGFLFLILNIYGIAFQDHITEDTPRGLEFINFSSSVNSLKYLYLFIFPVIFLGENKKNDFSKLLFLSLIYWWLFLVLFFVYFNYEMYFTRYLIPNIFLIISLIIAFKIKKIFKYRILKIGFFFTFILYLFLSFGQTLNTEYLKFKNGMDNLSSRVFANDIVLLFNYRPYTGSYFFNRMKLPMSYFYNKNVIAVNEQNFQEILQTDFLKNYDNIFLISETELFSPVYNFNNEVLYLEETYLEHTSNALYIPFKYNTNSVKLFINELNGVNN